MSDLPAAAAALSAEDRQDLVSSIKKKLEDLAVDHQAFLDALSPDVRKRVGSLREIQNQHDELEAKYFEERAALEVKYQKLYEPLYSKRYEIVNGVDEIERVPSGGVADHGTDQSAEVKGVPRFWLTAMKNNEVLSDEITERDEEALQYLKDIKWSRLDDSKGFKLEFFFNPNPYFTNTVLTKAYYMISEDDHILEKATGTEIEWFPEKNLTRKVIKKKPRLGSTDSKPVTKIEECVSFFNFFNPPDVPEDENEIDEATAELLQSQMEQDYSIGSTIREKIIPHAVSWFTGEAVESDEEDEDDADEDDDEDDADEDDDEDDADDESEEEENEEDEECMEKGDERLDAGKEVAR